MKIGIIGYTGKMGQALLNEIKHNSNDVTISALHSRTTSDTITEGIEITNSYLNLIQKSDVIIDFSRPESSIEIINHCLTYKKPIVCGTTGFTNTQMDEIRHASKYIKIFYASNMSLGIAILSDLMQRAINTFKTNNIPIEVSILERHHKHKVDKPSGTAISLANKITSTCSDIHPEMVSLRYGDNIGQHDVIISTDMEVLTLQHQATNRSVFASGAIAAAKFIFKQKVDRLYTMEDIINIK